MVSEINDGLICNFQRNEMKLCAEHFANNHSQRRVPCLKNKIPMILIISIELIRGSSDLPHQADVDRRHQFHCEFL